MMTTTQQRREPSREEMNAVFMLCRNNHWTSVYQCLQRNPQIGETVMIMVRFDTILRCVCLLIAFVLITNIGNQHSHTLHIMFTGQPYYNNSVPSSYNKQG